MRVSLVLKRVAQLASAVRISAILSKSLKTTSSWRCFPSKDFARPESLHFEAIRGLEKPRSIGSSKRTTPSTTRWPCGSQNPQSTTMRSSSLSHRQKIRLEQNAMERNRQMVDTAGSARYVLLSSTHIPGASTSPTGSSLRTTSLQTPIPGPRPYNMPSSAGGLSISCAMLVSPLATLSTR